jgi:hypothetical protein
VTELDSDTWVGEVKRIRGKKEPLSSAGFHALRDEYAPTIEPFRATLGVVWGHPAQTLDMPWYHRTLSNPRF